MDAQDPFKNAFQHCFITGFYLILELPSKHCDWTKCSVDVCSRFVSFIDVLIDVLFIIVVLLLTRAHLVYLSSHHDPLVVDYNGIYMLAFTSIYCQSKWIDFCKPIYLTDGQLWPFSQTQTPRTNFLKKENILVDIANNGP